MPVERKWYFAKNSTPSNEAADKLIDSKFGIDKVSSFSREIIQNSLDAHDDDKGDVPVRVKFDYKKFKLNEIPGGERLREVLDRCYNMPNLNHQTKDMYKKGLETLDSDDILCLKISDENTKGVKPGLDEAWGAFVYDEGISRKERPGSAGSHGVGKKAPFIISGVHTVFYSTNYSGKKLFEGKTSLVNWQDNDIDYDYRGWYGNVNEEETNRRKIVLPVEYETSIEGVNSFFLRGEETGTDVIIVDSSSLGKMEEAKIKIINAILENFFVAIIRKKLECDVFGEKINDETIDDIVVKYYLTQKVKFQRISNSDRVFDGNLNNYYRVFKNIPVQKKIDLVVDGKTYGYMEIYFELKNDKNKKYYSIVREHGMKIKDVRLDTDQAYTAVVLIRDYPDSDLREEERINGRLASRENAAHDDFIINDEQVPCDPTTKKLIDTMYKMIEDYIFDETKITADDSHALEGLSDMLNIPGSTSKGSVSQKKTPKLKKKKKPMINQGRGKEDPNGTAGTSAGNGGKHHGGKGKKKKVSIGDEVNAYIYDNFAKEPISLHLEGNYRITFVPNNNGNAFIIVKPISVDGGDTEIPSIIKKAVQGERELPLKGNIIKNIKMKQGQATTVDIYLQDGFDYAIDCDVLEEAKKDEE